MSLASANSGALDIGQPVSQSQSPRPAPLALRRPPDLGIALLAGVLGWVYGPTMAAISLRWHDTPEYSHGWLVPAFALWFAWSEGGAKPLRQLPWLPAAAFILGLAMVTIAPEWHQEITVATIGSVIAGCGASQCLPPPAGSVSIWGIAGWIVLLLGTVAMIAGGYYFVDWLTAAALLPILAGLALIRWGKSIPRSVCLAIPFLVFMVPLPFSVETALREPLRALSTKLSTYVLQVMGFSCFSEGYVILIGESRIGVTEACSGLSMLMVFAALVVGGIMLIPRPLWFKGILLASWPAIAIAANVFRIVTTGGLFAFGFEKLADITYHDLAGLAMMPVGLALLWMEMSYLDQLFVVDREQRLSPMLGAVAPKPLAKPERSPPDLAQRQNNFAIDKAADIHG